MHGAKPLPFGFAGAGGRQRCSAWEWNDHSRHLMPWWSSRVSKRSPAGYCEYALMAARKVRCPQCGRQAEWSKDNPFRPFCSQRCKLIDLGAWAAGEYCVASEASSDDFSLPDQPKPT